MDNWEEICYNSVFEDTYNSLKQTIKNNPDYDAKNIISLLENLYIQQGNNQLGRGEKMNITIEAQIAACEAILAEYNGKLQ